LNNFSLLFLLFLTDFNSCNLVPYNVSKQILTNSFYNFSFPIFSPAVVQASRVARQTTPVWAVAVVRILYPSVPPDNNRIRHAKVWDRVAIISIASTEVAATFPCARVEALSLFNRVTREASVLLVSFWLQSVGKCQYQ